MIANSPYLRLMRLHQPVGVWLLLWPCWWAAALASGGRPSLAVLALLGAGAVLMRSAGCIVNDIADREFDRQVERTKTRPLASGELSVPQALGLLAVLLLLSLAVAVALGARVVAWAACALPLVAAYPFMKRITWWPQLFLGLTFNWGALLGWVAVQGSPQLPAWLLYAGGVFWTLGYDTLYAHQDKTDDAKIGVKSTALRLGQSTPLAVRGFYLLAVLFWAAAGWAAGAKPLFFALILVAQYHLLRQVCRADLSNPASCRKAFVSNAQLGAIVLAACILAFF